MSPTPLDLDAAPIPVLRDLLASEDAGARSDAACALGDRLRTHEVTQLEADVTERLVALLSDPVSMVRFEAAITLAEARDVRALEVLVWALAYRQLRLDAVRALGALGDQRAVAPLKYLLVKWLVPWADRLQAAAALCRLGDAAGAEYLRAKLDSKKQPERAAAIHFVGESHHPEARVILEALVKETMDPMRDVAVRALGILGDPSARAVLEQARLGADAELSADIDAALDELRRRA